MFKPIWDDKVWQLLLPVSKLTSFRARLSIPRCDLFGSILPCQPILNRVWSSILSFWHKTLSTGLASAVQCKAIGGFDSQCGMLLKSCTFCYFSRGKCVQNESRSEIQISELSWERGGRETSRHKGEKGRTHGCGMERSIVVARLIGWSCGRRRLPERGVAAALR